MLIGFGVGVFVLVSFCLFGDIFVCVGVYGVLVGIFSGFLFVCVSS